MCRGITVPKIINLGEQVNMISIEIKYFTVTLLSQKIWFRIENWGSYEQIYNQYKDS